MLWVVHCLDAPGAAERRAALRADHSLRLREGGMRPVLYGPLVADGSEDAVGSLLVFDADDGDAVRRFVAEDPFATGGVWDDVSVHAFAQSQRSPNQLRNA